MRLSGILMPLFSLPSKYGIGTLGREAYRFIDFLSRSGQSYWQMLPVGPTGFGDSPYQSFSVFAGNPYFIDLDILAEWKYLSEEELEAVNFGGDTAVDYEKLYNTRFDILRRAAARFLKHEKQQLKYDVFCRYNAFWLDDYALFMALKDEQGGRSFELWEDGLKFRKKQAIAEARERLAAEIKNYKVYQYFFHKQWQELKKYSAKRGIKLIGDVPIYTSFDSSDVWANPELFELDEGLCPKCVAGVPPDAFSADGQLWGNPLYDWERMKSDNYEWWFTRFRQAFERFDMVRIDHFRGFSAYFSVPASAETAAEGAWVKGPAEDFFEVLSERLPDMPVIAEDLGVLDDGVINLLKFTGFPGMKVLQFAFDPESDSDYLPHNIDKNCVCYTGTHDNDTAIGFLKEGDPNQVKFAKDYMHIADDESFNWAMIKTALATRADTVILQMQDFLKLGNEARINTPSTACGNWRWRIDYSCINDWLSNIIYDVTKTYRRLPQRNSKKSRIKES